MTLAFPRAIAAAVLAIALLSPAVASAEGVARSAAPVPVASPAPNPFADVPTNSWAYQAVQRLFAQNMLDGYPDATFRGNRPVTRYEMAVAIERLSAAVEMKMAEAKAASAAPALSPDVIATMRRLVDEYQSELTRLASLEKPVDNVEKRVATLDQQTKKNTDDLARQQIRVTYFFRGPGTFSENMTAVNGRTALSTANGQVASIAAGKALPGRTSFTTGENPGLIGQNTAITGNTDHGTAYQVARLAFGGNFNKYFSYGLRFENREFFDNPVGNTTTSTPNYCTSAACSTVFVAASSAPVRLNYSWLKYTSPGKIYGQVGSFFANEARGLGLSYTNYITGAQVGFIPLDAKLNVELGYGTGVASGSNVIAGFDNQSQQQLFAHADYNFTNKLNLGGAYMNQIAMSGILWNPSALLEYSAGPMKGKTIVDSAGLPVTGAYLPAQTSIAVASVYGSYQFGNNFNLAFEGLHRFGNDTFTGKPWGQPNAFWAEGVLGEQHGGRGIAGVQTGRAGTNYVIFGYIASGFNSTGAYENITSTASYRALYINAPNGYQSAYVGVHHWIGANARVGLFWQHFSLLPGTDLPAGSASCPGCFLSSDTKNAYVLETLMQF